MYFRRLVFSILFLLQNKIYGGTCEQNFARTILGTSFFPSSNENFYFLSALGIAVESKSAGEKDKSKSKEVMPLWQLSRVSLKTLEAFKILQFHFPTVQSLIVREDSNFAMLLRFENTTCLRGKGAYSIVPFEVGTKKSIVEHGKFSAFYVNDEIDLFDETSQSLVNYDIRYMQVKKKHISLGSEETILYMDDNGQNRIVWMDGKIRGLERYNSEQVIRKIKFEDGAKLLQDKKKFGAIYFDSNRHELTIFKFNEFEISDKEDTKSYRVYLEKNENLTDANYFVNFDRGILAVLNKDIRLGLRWQTLTLYDYTNGWKIFTIKAPVNMEFGYCGISPNGHWLAIETRYSANGVTKDLGLYSVLQRKWVNISFKL